MEIFPLKNIFIATPSYLIAKKRDFTAGIKQLVRLGFNVINPEFPQALPSPQEKADQSCNPHHASSESRSAISASASSLNGPAPMSSS